MLSRPQTFYARFPNPLNKEASEFKVPLIKGDLGGSDTGSPTTKICLRFLNTVELSRSINLIDRPRHRSIERADTCGAIDHNLQPIRGVAIQNIILQCQPPNIGEADIAQ
jgi:hypothetical protein